MIQARHFSEVAVSLLRLFSHLSSVYLSDVCVFLPFEPDAMWACLDDVITIKTWLKKRIVIYEWTLEQSQSFKSSFYLLQKLRNLGFSERRQFCQVFHKTLRF